MKIKQQAIATRHPEEDIKERSLQLRVKAGHKLESEEEMTPRYREVLIQTMLIAADLELMTLPSYYGALCMAPTLDDKIAVAASIQDEMGHAQVMYRMLEDFGFDAQELIMERSPDAVKSFELIEQDVGDYITCVVMMALGDRAGYTTTRDLEANCSFGPYARSLRKVNFEERFHVAHGERWVKYFWQHSSHARQRVQAAVDLLFPMAASWFGTPDAMKKRTDQLTYNIRGLSNDELRQQWLNEVVPFCESVGIEIPAHFDRELGRYVLSYEEPIAWNEENKKWDFDTQITWPEKFAHWKKGGPIKRSGLERIQSERWGKELW
ncbi:1,2-phenylacetyl-CoA epoxidase subunit PaaC [Allopusillimonas ginsengisoli]|uniref:1,2-phenylacetyl-CoA epoxidase subunit PaaC n=1 Tax=Allopusillimonas ginsengisoli TaxID=453575 RepID=UPI001FD695B2|nr:Phenylacetic acid catabolic protein [Allopusillimonas ginsengisoli]